MAFFRERRAVVPADRVAAFDAVACDLRLAVEVVGEALLEPDGVVLLAAERQFHTICAVGRVLGLPDLVRVLERYATDPVYRPDDVATAKLRVEVCAALLRRLAVQQQLTGQARLLRRADEAIRIEAGALGPLRRIRARRAS